MKSRRSRTKLADPHVRLYGWGLASPAYRSLSPDARALLVEFRALFSGRENRVFFSIRDMMEKLGGTGQARAIKARNELLDRGWIREIERGSFHRKTRLATVYALTNEPIHQRDGQVAPKDYMRWQSPKTTVVKLDTDSTDAEYRVSTEKADFAAHGSESRYRQPEKARSAVAGTGTQIGYQAQLDALPLLHVAFWYPMTDQQQIGAILFGLLNLCEAGSSA
jgi:hypothetical protein